MSLKQLSKTRWKIEQDRVTIYPFGLFYIFSAAMAVIFGAIILLYIGSANPTSSESTSLVIFLLIIVVLFWASGNTRIEFDNAQGVMRKKLMGVIPVTTLPLSKLQGIDVVSNMAGSYNYRLFKKDDRYGKSIVVSSGYTKNDDPNAIAFVEQAVPVIHGFLDQHDAFSGTAVREPITSYKYFTESGGGVYTTKNKKAGAIVFGLFFIGIGVYLFNIPTTSAIGTLVMVLFMIGMGLVFINAAFTKVTFNPAAQTIERSGLLSFLNKRYVMANYVGMQTVRHSINFVYSGTSINLHFNSPTKANRQDVLTVASLRRGKNIERFLDELYQIMGV
ncbi:hypothetical protein KHS38_21785 [Mucilaginibacter sp. Bleaf8]|uniref:hypothetical protein n=1 Tax=Mucilaginibacter sp. Bleaf8 TaxID=2834430 RepID=UPI001BD06284|nr:hypothetical protein [Mucilaginibacter sp. Bleaf8]MBS7567051.1 hypothetical protein [Mucilaginibacter sp. Bleaf8]